MNVLLVNLPNLASSFKESFQKHFGAFNCLCAHNKEEVDFCLSQGVDYALVAYGQNENSIVDSAAFVDAALKNKCPTILVANKLTTEVRSLFGSTSILNYVINQEDAPAETSQQIIELIQRHINNHKISVLVVDDSAAYRAQISYFLTVHGLNVLTAKDGLEALEVIKKSPVRLVVTDYHMPKMDGLMLTKALRKMQGKDDVAIIAITATDGSNGATEFLKVGANDFLVKPYSREELICRIDQNLEIILLLDKMKDRANRDFLTDLHNRRFFLKHATARYKSCKEEGVSISVAMLDIDYFKKINDTYGHEAGDEALRQMSGILTRLVPEGQLVARLGGEEFAIFLMSDSAVHAEKIYESIRAAVEKSVVNSVNQVSFQQTVSIGWLSNDQMPESLSYALMLADKALYQAKHQGRNRVTKAE